ncbi:UbiA prenyltransferase family [Gymnopilus junonius]|uniref:UbiA prenyltransferase family n=1 Tax=Gymnopilus junonius TaxID=109634 RepID=A0A9P5NVZ0_GYMJU|nr:UbiA prenyltransferase family [Gymnopilus junonius]
MSSSVFTRLGSSSSSLASRLAYHTFTLFLFSKSDIKTTLIPVSFFSLGAAPLSPTNRVFWIWLHLLHFNLANQVRDPEEDMRNKPWRPLPSGRISLSTARVFRYLMPLVCMVVSLCYSRTIFYASAFFAALVPMYHELHGDAHWLSKNLMNAVGYACFAIGSTLIASNDRSKLDFTGALSIFIISAILATTIQAQDFQDVDGDKSVGRSTLPIAFPNLSRYTLLITLLLWSAYLTCIWEIGGIGSIGFTCLAMVVGLRYYLLRTTKDDEVSYFMYNIWLAVAFSMPGYWRFYKESAAL